MASLEREQQRALAAQERARARATRRPRPRPRTRAGAGSTRGGGNPARAHPRCRLQQLGLAITAGGPAVRRPRSAALRRAAAAVGWRRRAGRERSRGRGPPSAPEPGREAPPPAAATPAAATPPAEAPPPTARHAAGRRQGLGPRALARLAAKPRPRTSHAVAAEAGREAAAGGREAGGRAGAAGAAKPAAGRPAPAAAKPAGPRRRAGRARPPAAAPTHCRDDSGEGGGGGRAVASRGRDGAVDAAGAWHPWMHGRARRHRRRLVIEATGHHRRPEPCLEGGVHGSTPSPAARRLILVGVVMGRVVADAPATPPPRHHRGCGGWPPTLHRRDGSRGQAPGEPGCRQPWRHGRHARRREPRVDGGVRPMRARRGNGRTARRAPMSKARGEGAVGATKRRERSSTPRLAPARGGRQRQELCSRAGSRSSTRSTRRLARRLTRALRWLTTPERWRDMLSLSHSRAGSCGRPRTTGEGGRPPPRRHGARRIHQPGGLYVPARQARPRRVGLFRQGSRRAPASDRPAGRPFGSPPRARRCLPPPSSPRAAGAASPYRHQSAPGPLRALTHAQHALAL